MAVLIAVFPSLSGDDRNPEARLLDRTIVR